jgi:hypothetical protein
MKSLPSINKCGLPSASPSGFTILLKFKLFNNEIKNSIRCFDLFFA